MLDRVLGSHLFLTPTKSFSVEGALWASLWYFSPPQVPLSIIVVLLSIPGPSDHHCGTSPPQIPLSTTVVLLSILGPSKHHCGTSLYPGSLWASLWYFSSSWVPHSITVVLLSTTGPSEHHGSTSLHPGLSLEGKTARFLLFLPLYLGWWGNITPFSASSEISCALQSRKAGPIQALGGWICMAEYKKPSCLVSVVIRMTL